MKVKKMEKLYVFSFVVQNKISRTSEKAVRLAASSNNWAEARTVLTMFSAQVLSQKSARFWRTNFILLLTLNEKLEETSILRSLLKRSI